MHKKIFISLLVPVLINFFVGCYSLPVTDPDNDGETNSTIDQRNAGAKVLIIMNNGEEYTGELLRVRDSTIILCKEYEASEEDLSDLVYPFYSLQNEDIKQIKLKGENHLVGGIVFGSLGGIVAGLMLGTAIAYGSSNSETSFTSATAGFLIAVGIGILIGSTIGTSNTTYDEVVYEYAYPEEYDFTKLNIYSRYGSKEPTYLKDIK
jgi:hypothetical protein